ncbi:MAG: hypothetical protein ABGY75_11345 [Gemmataceae bacterium]
MFTPAHLLVCTLTVFAGRDRSADLPDLLRRIEPLPEQQSGEVRTVHPGYAPDYKPTEYLYQYTLDGKHFVNRYFNLSLLETEMNQSGVSAANERYEYELVRRDGQWVQNWIRPLRWKRQRFARQHPEDGRENLTHIAFSPSFSVEATYRPLSELMAAADSPFAVTVSRIERQVYRVAGRRREPAVDGVQEFDTTVRVSANGRYAYIAGVKTVWVYPPANRDETEYTYTTREGDDRPDLTRREWVSRHTGPGVDRTTRGHTTYTSRPVTDDDRRRMHLQHYGLTEPDVDSWPDPADFTPRPAGPAPHPGWWALLAVPAGYLLILGRILWRAFRRPLNGIRPG